MSIREMHSSSARSSSTSARTTAAKRWLHQLGRQLDLLGNAERERHARVTAQRPGYALLETPDGLVRYRMHGEGPSVVFAADPPVTLEQYDELCAELSRDFRVIVVETPGFGFSTLRQVGSGFSFERMNEGLREVLVALGHGPYVLAFPCVSSFTALYVAQRAPALVSALVLAQAPCWSEMLRWKARRDPAGVLSVPLLGQLVMRAAKRRRSPEWFAVATGSRERRIELTASADRALREGAGFALASVFQDYLVGAPPLPPAEVPTLFIWGLRDRSHAQTDRSSSLLLAPHARVLEAPQLGHFPELEDPAWFGASLRSFLAEL